LAGNKETEKVWLAKTIKWHIQRARGPRRSSELKEPDGKRGDLKTPRGAMFCGSATLLRFRQKKGKGKPI